MDEDHGQGPEPQASAASSQPPTPELAPIAPLEAPGFHPDDSLIESSMRNEYHWGEARQLELDVGPRDDSNQPHQEKPDG
jgi:hypothetical protein